MNKFLNKNLYLNILILSAVIFQIMIFLFNTKSDKEINVKISNTVEKFTTIIAGDSGVDVISADKLIKIDEQKTLLVGDTNLKNQDHEISSSNVMLDSEKNITSSKSLTKTTNNQGTMISEGFEFQQDSNLIKFNGKSEFRPNE